MVDLFSLRDYRPTDAPALLALFRDTIRRVNVRDYGPEQIRAWASDEIDTAAWADRFVGRFALVAEQAGMPIGFAELEDDGHLDRLYVSADHQRIGVGRALMNALIAEAKYRGLAKLYAEVSITARAFFTAHGFAVLAEQSVIVRGIEFINYRMQQRLDEAPLPSLGDGV